MTESEDELSKTRAMLHKTQGYLRDEQAKHNQIVMKLKLELYQTQTNLKQQQAKSDKQLSEVIGHLLYLEGRLKKERTKVRNDILKKSKLIEEQKKYIEKLKVQNDQLLNAVKELYTCGGMNGIMRDWNSRSGKSPQNGRKNGKGHHTPQSSHKSKLHLEKDEVWKRRGSLELSTYEVKKTLLENERLCSSQENLHTEVTSENVARGDNLDKTLNDKSDRQNGKIDNGKIEGKCQNGSEPVNGHDNDESHDVHNDTNGFAHDTSMNSDSDLNTTHNTSEVSGATDMSLCDISINDSTHVYDLDDDDDDEQIFSFSSTHINSVIAEEDVNDPIMTHSGHMMSMGSMPMLTNIHDPGHMLYSAKNRPHSLSSVDLNSIQQQAQKLAKLQLQESLSESPTPPPSPLYKQLSHDSPVNPVNKNEKTAFQSFKNMFHRRGSKHKGAHKKRSVSLSQTTNKEYTEAMKKHFQKYDMS